MKRMTLSEYLAVPENYRGVWTTERWDIPDWENLRKSHMGKRTLMVYDKGTCLLVEGLSLEIVDDSSWKKPEEIKKEIREKYQDYRTEKGREPHFLECIIRWNDTLETLETRIALDMDSDTEMDDEIFFYCDTLDSLLSLADRSGEDFVIAGCFGFGEYEETVTDNIKMNEYDNQMSGTLRQGGGIRKKYRRQYLTTVHRTIATVGKELKREI